MALQRWNKSATPVVGSNGVNTYTFPAIPQGFNALVSVSVPTSPPGTQWTIFVAGGLLGSVYGASPYGPIWLGQGDVVTITGTPLSTSGVAVAVGAIGLSGEIPPSSLSPQPGTGPLGVVSLLAAGTASGTAAFPSLIAQGLLIKTSVSALPVVTAVGADIVGDIYAIGINTYVVPLIVADALGVTISLLGATGIAVGTFTALEIDTPLTNLGPPTNATLVFTGLVSPTAYLTFPTSVFTTGLGYSYVIAAASSTGSVNLLFENSYSTSMTAGSSLYNPPILAVPILNEFQVSAQNTDAVSRNITLTITLTNTPPTDIVSGLETVYKVTVPNPVAGADWSYTLPAPARLCSLWARLTASIAVATRYPDLLVTWPGGSVLTFLPMSAAGVVASVVQDVAMGPGLGPITSVTETGVDVKCMVGFPDMLLPASCTLATSTKNIAAADQWAPIELTFSPV